MSHPEPFSTHLSHLNLFSSRWHPFPPTTTHFRAASICFDLAVPVYSTARGPETRHRRVSSHPHLSQLTHSHLDSFSSHRHPFPPTANRFRAASIRFDPALPIYSTAEGWRRACDASRPTHSRFRPSPTHSDPDNRLMDCMDWMCSV